MVLFFSVISPLVPFVAFFFFTSRFCILRYQFLFVFTPEYSLGGKFWFEMVYYTMQGLMLFSVTMLLYTTLKQGFWQSLSLLPLPAVIWYQWGRLDATFGKVGMGVCLSVCSLQLCLLFFKIILCLLYSYDFNFNPLWIDITRHCVCESYAGSHTGQ